MKQVKWFAKKFLEQIKKHKHIIIFHHLRPDGDCLGSQHGLKEWIKEKFPCKEVYAVGSSEGIFPFLNFKFDEIPKDEILKEALGIVVDANYSNRIVDSWIITEKKIKTMIRIDHHPEEDDIDYVLRFVDPSYCSSAEQVANIIRYVDKTITNKRIAELLYLGIYTDSGRFFHDYTSARTHEIVAWLMGSNFDFFTLHKNLAKRSMDEIKFNQYVFDNYKTYENVIYCYISFDDIVKLNIDDTSSNRVDFLANIENYDIWIFFIENKDGSIRVRLRSSDKDISSIARQYNGGGHKKASGAIIYEKSKIDEIVKKAAQLSK